VAAQPGSRLLLHSRPYQAAPLALQRRLLRRVLNTVLPAAVTDPRAPPRSIRGGFSHSPPNG
jgi:hypothetical protein